MGQHNLLTGADLHESKGVATATSGQVYVADGAGSGVWTTQITERVILTKTVPLQTAGNYYIACPVAGTINRIDAVLENSFSTSDGSITFSIGNTSIDSSTLTITQSGSAAGQEFNATPSGHNTVVAGSVIKVTVASGPTGTANVSLALSIQVTS